MTPSEYLVAECRYLESLAPSGLIRDARRMVAEGKAPSFSEHLRQTTAPVAEPAPADDLDRLDTVEPTLPSDTGPYRLWLEPEAYREMVAAGWHLTAPETRDSRGRLLVTATGTEAALLRLLDVDAPSYGERLAW